MRALPLAVVVPLKENVLLPFLVAETINLGLFHFDSSFEYNNRISGQGVNLASPNGRNKFSAIDG